MGDLRSSLGDGFVNNGGTVLLLFETPSGFAIFGFCGIYLYEPDAIESLWANFVHYETAKEIVWLHDFQTFDDKSSAISVGTGVNKQLSDMIMKWLGPGQTLVVGKWEYKSIIESSLEINCLHDEIVMELMWGMQRLMHRLVGMEKSELAKEDRVPMSQGLQMLLSRHGFHVKPEMVNEEIVVAAVALFNYDAANKEEYPALHTIGRYLKDVSGIDCRTWRPVKLATAFKIICTHEIEDSDEMLPKDLQLKLQEGADRYNDLINKAACMETYRKLVYVHRIGAQSKGILASLVKKAKAHEADRLELHENKEYKPMLNRCG
ncbi:unnamed protein product [Urochloa decumbens]|uniref:Uncharacterized protein n=1 Tax=Urochloa decumbens TaxID=240449 RepID=A0ABC9A7V6_9POAL